MSLHQGNTRAIACGCVHERLALPRSACGYLSQLQYLIKYRPAQIAMSISCGPSKMMGTQTGIAHGILHAPQILSHHVVDVPKVRSQLRGCIPHLHRQACEIPVYWPPRIHFWRRKRRRYCMGKLEHLQLAEHCHVGDLAALEALQEVLLVHETIQCG